MLCKTDFKKKQPNTARKQRNSLTNKQLNSNKPIRPNPSLTNKRINSKKGTKHSQEPEKFLEKEAIQFQQANTSESIINKQINSINAHRKFSIYFDYMRVCIYVEREKEREGKDPIGGVGNRRGVFFFLSTEDSSHHHLLLLRLLWGLGFSVDLLTTI